jgi:cyclic nucleotide-binding protein
LLSAIVFGNILDTIPRRLVIGVKFTVFSNLSLTPMPQMFSAEAECDALMAILARPLAAGRRARAGRPCHDPSGSGRKLLAGGTSVGCRHSVRVLSGFGAVFVRNLSRRPGVPMIVSNADLSTIMDRILDTAADNFRIAKILIQLGLDPNNITYDAIFNRLLEIVLANITVANMFALIGAVFFVATLLTQTMVPLRVANMVGCACFAGFGALAGDVKTFLLYLLLLPINAFRLRQMLNLVKKARTATQGDTSMEWLKPFMTERKYRKGDVLFRKDDAAKEMFLTVTGKFWVTEIGVALPPGRLMGELGFLSPDNRRTATIECTEDGHVLTITYEKLLEIYFQNPQFGYYFLVLTSQRLLENISRLEATVAQGKIAQQTTVAGGTD